MRSHVFIGLALGAALSVPAGAASPAAPKPATAIFAGGCFWSEEKAFEGQPGVLSVTSGYTGGTRKNPSYEEVSSGATGHLESVEVEFDPNKTSYDKLLEIYWHNIDPFDGAGQFCDDGPEYHSAIFYANDAQKSAAEESKRKLEEKFKEKIQTQVLPAAPFYPAEEYHQDFAKKNPVRYHAYRVGCGRDARLAQIWGSDSGGHAK